MSFNNSNDMYRLEARKINLPKRASMSGGFLTKKISFPSL